MGQMSMMTRMSDNKHHDNMLMMNIVGDGVVPCRMFLL